MDKYKKFMYIGIFILLISLVSSAGTYAFFTWISTSNTNVTLSILVISNFSFYNNESVLLTFLTVKVVLTPSV